MRQTTILILYMTSTASVVAKEEQSRVPKKYRGMVLLLRDIGVAAALVALVLLAMFAYTGQWPPLVVIESDSMMHGTDNLSHIGTIDTGDLVLVQDVNSVNDIVTYTEGCSKGYRTYGDYGDVIIYTPNGRGDVTPIIHRAMIYLEVNSDGLSYRAESLRDLPSVKWSVSNPLDSWDRLTSTLTIYDVGYSGAQVTINMGGLGSPLKAGFITKGDHNSAIDQPYRSENIELGWVVGKARGEIPWFGLLKLWSTNTLKGAAPENSVRDLWICIALIVVTPILVDIGLTYREKKRIAQRRALNRKVGEQAGIGEEKGKGDGSLPPR